MHPHTPETPRDITHLTQPRPARQHAHATSGCCRAIPRRGQGAGTGALVLHNTACALSSASLLRCTKQRRAAWAAAEGACMSPRIAKIRKGRGGVSRPPPPLVPPRPPALSISTPPSLPFLIFPPRGPRPPSCFTLTPPHSPGPRLPGSPYLHPCLSSSLPPHSPPPVTSGRPPPSGRPLRGSGGDLHRLHLGEARLVQLRLERPRLGVVHEPLVVVHVPANTAPAPPS